MTGAASHTGMVSHLPFMISVLYHRHGHDVRSGIKASRRAETVRACMRNTIPKIDRLVSTNTTLLAGMATFLSQCYPS
jgi:hypothetical protein